MVLEADTSEEKDWNNMLVRNEAFDFLNDPSEDIYTISDGKPFENEK